MQSIDLVISFDYYTTEIDLPINGRLMLHDAIDHLGGKAGHIVDGGELARRQHHTGIRVDRQRNAHVHVHVVQPIVVGL